MAIPAAQEPQEPAAALKRGSVAWHLKEAADVLDTLVLGGMAGMTAGRGSTAALEHALRLVQRARQILRDGTGGGE